MNITIVSCFRNSASYIARYFDQVQGLHNLLAQRGDSLNLLLGHGDSTDGTGEMLFEECSHRFAAHLLDVSHGGQVYGSIENAQRFRQLAAMGNKLLACVSHDADVVGIVESDLIWDAPTLLALIDHLQHVPAIAPMVMDGPNSFYDVYAHRMDGQRFTKTPPYLPRQTRGDLIQDGLMQLDSAGSVLFMHADLARQVRFTEDEAVVGLCKQIYVCGGSVWLDVNAQVTHPQVTHP